ncbi:hypothetical protein KUCAC02_002731 [Chaenocephalus aceratus]|uniref:Uncharacterized protein n=1 Tax=Chaenocephalus aceratus TaxID=36190 RepID=A0ACB9XWM6_CHAAC|nr:hypothetical protein KUCAC02_002731 [Chaenocephalus aceratus]
MDSETDNVTFGPSTGNQRIERWWLTLRSECVQFWMDLFDKLSVDGYFSDNFLDKSLIQFCFLQIIQEELDEVVLRWNNHRVRQVHNSRSPHGCPSILHAVPHLAEIACTTWTWRKFKQLMNNELDH